MTFTLLLSVAAYDRPFKAVEQCARKVQTALEWTASLPIIFYVLYKDNWPMIKHATRVALQALELRRDHFAQELHR